MKSPQDTGAARVRAAANGLRPKGGTTVKSFVVLAARRFRERARMDLSAQFGFIKRHNALWVPSELLGMWVGAEREIVAAHRPATDSSAGTTPGLVLDIQSALGVSGSWMVFYVQDSALTRACLLDELVARSAGLAGNSQSRFIPVFPRSTPDGALRSELAQLCARHPDEVCPPLLMNTMTGALSPVVASPGVGIPAPDGL